MTYTELFEVAGIEKSEVMKDGDHERIVAKKGVTLFAAGAEFVTKIGGKPGSSCPNWVSITNVPDGPCEEVYINAK